MAAKDDPGLLSKVVRFVKNTTTNWADLDQQETERESSYSKQMLKEMIERKRRNDFVRKREFDMLRKMRRSEVMAGQDPAARPSFFQSSMPSKPDDRATTLKKIDEIEAQMSMQWWKTKHADTAARTGGPTSQFPVSTHMPPDSTPGSRPVGSPTLKSTAYTRTEPQPLVSAKDADKTRPVELQPMLDVVTPAAVAAKSAVSVSEQPASAQPPSLSSSSSGSSRMSSGAAAGPVSEPSGGASAFTPSKLFAIDVDEFAHDPELEEAAIRFANGDSAGAEAGLLEVLAPHGARVNHDETWLTLFDLYRATGQQDRFETAAIDFASRFGRSAPQWFSLPELVGRMTTVTPSSLPSGQAVADWTSPAVFGTQTLAAMNAALAKAPAPWRLAWTKLNSIAESAVEPLTKMFTQWASQPVQLRFIGADVFEKVLKEATPSGDRGVNPAWWKLRMEVLRVMHRPDEFELVALDYCVTYEVSPPSWDSARCDFKALQADGSLAHGHTIIGEAFRDSLASGMNTAYGDTQMPSMSSQMSNVSTVELAGHISGDATEAVDTLEARLAGADVMVISCSRLVRIDFSAAGTLLNWVTARQAEGRQVQFVEVHRLVAAFFNVIGISEHARIIPRHD
ncbi:MAG TPA: STAS domain-containing protein [Ramlibacter sp.]|uniref:STAS domain-containing protein n=1 Tax=Ramlibacter sp. TaxID=1917967 RepID=UPI002C835707|nr:STAS domain-containing protein [Ramlibacter sp.]HVZ45395.1 STAS domain-containing protein [Ramlibacter sp.]